MDHAEPLQPTTPASLSPELALTLVESLPGPVLLLDCADRVYFANQSALKTLQSSADQIYGQPFLSLIHAASSARASTWLDALRRGLINIVELPHRTGDGGSVLLSYQTTTMAAPGSSLPLLVLMGTEISTPLINVRLHQQLLERSGQLQAVLEAIDSGVMLVDREGVVCYANARLGVLLDVDIRDWPEAYHTSNLTHLIQPYQAGSMMETNLWRTHTEPPRILRRFTDNVFDADGEQIGTIEVYTDISELEAMNQLKDEFVAAAAHDLKTPVTAIKGYAQIAMRLARRLNDQRVIQQLEVINARSNDLTYLMDSVLDMSRLQAGRLRLELKTFTVQEMVAKVLQHIEYDLQRLKRTITVEQPAEPISVHWDRARIERVLLNVLNNAIKYSPQGAPVSLRVCQVPPADQADPCVEIAVTDYGIGIPEAERRRIFERFYRVRQAIDEGFKGTGMGLYLANSIVAEHGGSMCAVDALHGGQGITMIVSLPLSVQTKI